MKREKKDETREMERKKMGKKKGTRRSGRDRRWRKFRKRREKELAGKRRDSIDDAMDLGIFMIGRRTVVVSGNTAACRSVLKANGFRWDPTEKEWWRLRSRCSDSTFASLRSLSGVYINEGIDLKDDQKRRRRRSAGKVEKVMTDAVTISGERAHLLKSDLRAHHFRIDLSKHSWWRDAEGFSEDAVRYFRSFSGVVVKFGTRLVPKVAALVAE